MKWLCNIKHNWSYLDDSVKLKIGQLSLKRRICQRCGIKQVQSLTSGKWYNTVLTIDEIRDKKLRDLGI